MPAASDQSADMQRGAAGLLAWVDGIRARLKRWQRPLGIAIAVLFIGGIVWSVGALDLSADRINWGALAILALVMVPASQTYGAAGMVLLARAGGHGIAWSQAVRSNNYAQLAEVLPLPGGAIVRTGALVSAGSSRTRGALLVTGGAVLWVAVAACAAGLTLELRGNPAGLALIAPSVPAIAALVFLFARSASWGTALLLLAHRLLGLVLTAVRLWLSFSAVGSTLRPFEMMPFALATIAGSASSIAPAGLGVSEAMAALIAGSMATAPAIAFLGVALNRLVGLGMVAVMVGVDHLRDPGSRG